MHFIYQVKVKGTVTVGEILAWNDDYEGFMANPMCALSWVFEGCGPAMFQGFVDQLLQAAWCWFCL